MKIFLDSANIEEIREAVDWGIIDGVTTNPSLMAREKGRGMAEIAKEICRVVRGPVSLEGGAETFVDLVAEGRKMSKIARNVIYKIPMGIDGIKAARKLSGEGIKTNITLVFSVNQALLAAKAGATYVSPFIGRFEDIGQSGLDLISEIVTVYDNYGFGTEILAASIRSSEHVRQVALAGADVSTLPMKVLRAMYSHHLTDKGMEIFRKDWKTKIKD